MENLTITLRAHVVGKMQDIVPVNLSPRDLEWFADWFISVGIETVRMGLENHPELSLGDLIKLTNRWH